MYFVEEMRGSILLIRGNPSPDGDPAGVRGIVTQSIRTGINEVVVDLTKARWIGSQTIGALAASLKALRDAGGDLHLAASGRVVNMLEMCNLRKAFRIFDEVEEAIQAFRAEE
jgi:anti-anti-sigma factor